MSHGLVRAPSTQGAHHAVLRPSNVLLHPRPGCCSTASNPLLPSLTLWTQNFGHVLDVDDPTHLRYRCEDPRRRREEVLATLASSELVEQGVINAGSQDTLTGKLPSRRRMRWRAHRHRPQLHIHVHPCRSGGPQSVYWMGTDRGYSGGGS